MVRMSVPRCRRCVAKLCLKLCALITLAIYVFTPPVASANPIILNPSSLLAFSIVAFRALVVEPVKAQGLSAFSGAQFRFGSGCSQG